ncbi:MAG: class I SAM-dependent methyltransferase [Myxococcota bacterium]|nr:class I SAM-dependent methyltransferase [Myxococcota bacterium]
MSDYIHGGSDAREVARLEKQAGFVAPWMHPQLRAQPGQRVLDLATGVGAMAAQLRRRFPQVQLVGVDLRRPQLRQALRLHPGLTYVQADGAVLPFGSGAFDHVHCSWLLEHVPDPVAILKEVHRVLRPGGEALFVEVDNATFRTVPLLEEVKEVMRLLDQAQLRGGGDPYVGRKLQGYFREAGFAGVEPLEAHLHGHAGEPVHFQGLIDEFAEIFESLDEALGPELTATLQRAAAQLRGLIKDPQGELHYRPVLIRGIR